MIHLIRDPRDNAASVLSARMGRYYQPLNHIDTWRESYELAHHNEHSYPGQYITVRYEDLVTYPEETIRQVCEIINLPFNRGMLDMSGHLGWKGSNSFFDDIGYQSTDIALTGIGRYQKHLDKHVIFLYQHLLEKELLESHYALQSFNAIEYTAYLAHYYTTINLARSKRTLLRQTVKLLRIIRLDNLARKLLHHSHN